VNHANTAATNANMAYEMNTSGLPNYDTVAKEVSSKETIPPPYNFVATHPTDFGLDDATPNAPPGYSSRPNSARMSSNQPTTDGTL
jgi:hypothetical protein